MKLSKALIYLVVAAVIWGATVPIMKITLREIPIFSLVFIRMATASLILLPFVYKRLKINRADMKTFILAAVFGTNLNLAFLFFGLRYSLAINASVIIAITPVLTLILAHIFLREKFSAKLVLGSIFAVLGVLAILGVPILHFDLMSTIGNLSLVAASFAWVGHEIFSKKILKKYNFVTSAFYTTTLGALFFSPIALYEIIHNPVWISNVTTSGFLGLLYGIFAASLVGYVAWQKGLSQTTASEASFVFYIMPLSGILFSVLLLHESPPAFLIVGAALIFLGVILAEFHRKTQPLTKSLD